MLTGFSDILDIPELLYIALWLLAAASTTTVVVRVLKVRRQALVLDAATAARPDSAPEA